MRSSGVPAPLASGMLAALSAAATDYGSRDIAELPQFLREALLQNFPN